LDFWQELSKEQGPINSACHELLIKTAAIANCDFALYQISVSCWDFAPAGLRWAVNQYNFVELAEKSHNMRNSLFACITASCNPQI
jgi:hypothetical protein